ncbi:MAG TPA: serine hydrolase domain-containing protein [Acidimicrobiales bacterium]|nr:serine hydrolase domain-containing protein [Acidimicrobiales bacterium]
MRRKVCLGLAGALLAAACSGDQGTEAPAVDAVPSAGDPKLATAAAGAIRAHDLPAMAVAYVSLHQGVLVGIAGTRGHGDGTPVSVDSRFHIGSDTKAMTAVLVAQLVQAGELTFDSRIADVLANAAVDASLGAITVRDVLGHRTGLVDDLDLRGLHEATDAVAARREAVYEALRSPRREPDSYAYANLNYMLAGVLVEEILARSWTDIIEERLFAPLEMTSCGFGAPLGDLDPLGHTAEGTPIPHDAPVSDNPPALGPAGTVHCSIGDWAKFATAMLEVLTGTDNEILSAATAADLFAGEEHYVAGWLRTDRDGEVSYGHDGSNTLWYARAVLRPAQRDAVLIASNTGERSAMRAIDELTGAVLRDWPPAS